MRRDRYSKYAAIVFLCVALTVLGCGGGESQRINATSDTVAAGGEHSLAVRADGTAWAWGYNSHGQIGDDTTEQRNMPVQITGPGGANFLAGVASVAAGEVHSLALKRDGTVWAWGWNAFGQLGDNTTEERLAPVQVAGVGGSGVLSDVVAIAAGRLHSLALKNNGAVFAWGWNASGQLGDNTTEERHVPVQVLGPSGSGFLTNVVAIAAGGEGNSLALRQDGTVWAWGWNIWGQLGDNTTEQRNIPVQVIGPGSVGFLSGIVDIATGRYHSLALRADGTVWAWGYGGNGAVGDNTTQLQRNTPVQVAGAGGIGYLLGVVSIKAGWYHSLARTGDGTIWAWGENIQGQLGDNTTNKQYAPVHVKGPGGSGVLAGVESITAGDSHTMAMTTDGTVWAWGSSWGGKLGDGSGDSHQTPSRVLFPTP